MINPRIWTDLGKNPTNLMVFHLALHVRGGRRRSCDTPQLIKRLNAAWKCYAISGLTRSVIRLIHNASRDTPTRRNISSSRSGSGNRLRRAATWLINEDQEPPAWC